MDISFKNCFARVARRFSEWRQKGGGEISYPPGHAFSVPTDAGGMNTIYAMGAYLTVEERRALRHTPEIDKANELIRAGDFSEQSIWAFRAAIAKEAGWAEPPQPSPAMAYVPRPRGKGSPWSPYFEPKKHGSLDSTYC